MHFLLLDSRGIYFMDCDLKTCKKCEVDFDLVQFNKLKTGKNGLHPWCKKCCSSYKKTYGYYKPKDGPKYKPGTCTRCSSFSERTVGGLCHSICYQTDLRRDKGIQAQRKLSKEEITLERREKRIKKREQERLASIENGTYVPKMKELSPAEYKERVKTSKTRERNKNSAAYATRHRNYKLKLKEHTLSNVKYKDLQPIYDECKEISRETEVQHHVDHIIPLKNDKVCGLNVPWNLQVLTASENCSKSNKFDYTNENTSWKNE